MSFEDSRPIREGGLWQRSRIRFQDAREVGAETSGRGESDNYKLWPTLRRTDRNSYNQLDAALPFSSFLQILGYPHILLNKLHELSLEVKAAQHSAFGPGTTQTLVGELYKPPMPRFLSLNFSTNLNFPLLISPTSRLVYVFSIQSSPFNVHLY
jgi:hypothetical protein